MKRELFFDIMKCGSYLILLISMDPREPPVYIDWARKISTVEQTRVTSSYLNQIYNLKFLILLINKLFKKILLLHTSSYDKFLTNFMWISNEQRTGNMEWITPCLVKTISHRTAITVNHYWVSMHWHSQWDKLLYLGNTMSG